MTKAWTKQMVPNLQSPRQTLSIPPVQPTTKKWRSQFWSRLHHCITRHDDGSCQLPPPLLHFQSPLLPSSQSRSFFSFSPICTSLTIVTPRSIFARSFLFYLFVSWSIWNNTRTDVFDDVMAGGFFFGSVFIRMNARVLWWGGRRYGTSAISICVWGDIMCYRNFLASQFFFLPEEKRKPSVCVAGTFVIIQLSCLYNLYWNVCRISVFIHHTNLYIQYIYTQQTC